MNVEDQMTGVGIRIHDFRSTTALEQVTHSFVSAVIAGGEGGLQPSHPAAQVGSGGAGGQMVVIEHKYRGMKVDPEA